jgi:hypothetical protein
MKQAPTLPATLALTILITIVGAISSYFVIVRASDAKDAELASDIQEVDTRENSHFQEVLRSLTRIEDALKIKNKADSQ